jgi:hypothetical protein
MRENETCPHCAAGLKPVKMRRQWIHHDRRTGEIAVCEAMALKPGS